MFLTNQPVQPKNQPNLKIPTRPGWTFFFGQSGDLNKGIGEGNHLFIIFSRFRSYTTLLNRTQICVRFINFLRNYHTLIQVEFFKVFVQYTPVDETEYIYINLNWKKNRMWTKNVDTPFQNISAPHPLGWNNFPIITKRITF